MSAILVLNAPQQRSDKTMNYNNITFIIPVLATGYVMTVYIVLILAQRVAKMTRGTSWRSEVAESQSKS